jgi:hypothetical protein
VAPALRRMHEVVPVLRLERDHALHHEVPIPDPPDGLENFS